MEDQEHGKPAWPSKRLEAAKTQWARGEPAFGMRPLAVGRFVLRWLQERDVRRLRRAMKAADGRDESDELFCALGNLGYGVPQAEGDPVTVEHVAHMLEYLGMARVAPEADKWSWHRVLKAAFGATRVYDVSQIYARATGLEDAVIFHELIGDEMRERLRHQRHVLVESGFMAPLAYARPALHRYPADSPELIEPRQPSLFDDKED